MAHSQNVDHLRIAVLTPVEQAQLLRELSDTRGGSIRIGIDTDGIKLDTGWGWCAGFGRLANEAGR